MAEPKLINGVITGGPERCVEYNRLDNEARKLEPNSEEQDEKIKAMGRHMRTCKECRVWWDWIGEQGHPFDGDV